MIGRHLAHAAAVTAAAILMVGLFLVPTAMAQSAKAKTATDAWHDCTSAADAAQREAIARATELLALQWLATERGRFAAYTMAGEKRNPFDLSPKSPDAAPRDGVVQARPPACAWQPVATGNALVVRFTTPFYRFYEAGPGWSAPLRNGIMLEATVARAGENWQASDTSGERGILLPEQKPRAARAATLPPDAAWAEPMPGCARRTKWNGEACVARKR